MTAALSALVAVVKRAPAELAEIDHWSPGAASTDVYVLVVFWLTVREPVKSAFGIVLQEIEMLLKK